MRAMSQYQNAGQNHSITIDFQSFERVEHFKFLGTTSTNQNPIHEEVKGRLKTRNAYYHSVQNLPSSSLVFKNIKLM
jgi:hypothetical protein